MSPFNSTKGDRLSLAARIDGFQRRHPKAGFPLAVVYKFFDDQGAYLAAIITYYAVVSLFPLLMLLTTVLGFVLENNPSLRDEIVNSALDQIPVVGHQLSEPGALRGGVVAVTVGVVGALYGGLGVAVASQNAMNVVWAVPRNDRPNPIQARIRGLILLFTVGIAILGLVTLHTVSAAVEIGTVARLISIAGSVLLAVFVFTAAFRIGTARSVSTVDVLPGAVVAGIGWQLLQEFGSVYVERVIARISVVSSVFAVLLGLIGFVYLASLLIVFCLELNAVRVNKLYPRALFTPFTDNVILTKADKTAYIAAAKAQRHKGFENIEVKFDTSAVKSGTSR